MRRLFLLFSMVMLVLFLESQWGIGVFAGEQKKGEAKPVTVTTTYGNVSGHVYDARTKMPIVEAFVVIQEDGQFAEKGKTTGRTDSTGKYKIQARLGRVSESIDVGKLLYWGAVVGLLFGEARKQTKKIDVSSLNVRVVKEGYKPFEGMVTVRKADAAAFSVELEPILLAPVSAPEASGVAAGWGPIRLASLRVEPAVLRPGSKAQIVAEIEGPKDLLKQAVEQKEKSKSKTATALTSLKLSCYSMPPYFYRSPERVKFVLFFPVVSVRTGIVKKLRLQPDFTADKLVFRGTFPVSKQAKSVDEILVAFVEETPFEIVEAAASRTCLLQVACSEEEYALAQKRVEAMSAFQEAQDAALALEKMQEICQSPLATAADFRRLAEFAEATHQYALAAEAMKKAIDKLAKKDKDVLLGEYGRLLLLADEPQKVLNEFLPLVESIPAKSRPQQVPYDVMVSIGWAYLNTGEMEKATKINEELRQWKKTTAVTKFGAEFRQALRNAQAEAAYKAKPDDPQAIAEYARLLGDSGRWDEAVALLRKAVQKSPQDAGLQWDLHYALTKFRGSSASREALNLDEALKAAEAATTSDPKTGKTKDFYAWHRLALLQYRKAHQLSASNDPAASEMKKRCQESLLEALKCSRAAAKEEESEELFGPGRLVTITGFAFVEANYDYLIFEALRVLENNPKDYLAYYNLAYAFLQLEQYDLATQALQEVQQRQPDFPQAHYIAALLAAQEGNLEVAEQKFKEVLQQNPWHPDAQLRLAEIYMQQGNPVAAAACLAAHAEWYGKL